MGTIGVTMKEDVKSLYGRLEAADDPVQQVEILGELAANFIHNDLDRCLATAAEMIAISEGIGYKEGLAAAYHARARVSAKTMQYDQAIEQLRQALDYLKDSPNLILKARVYDGLGVTYSHSGKFEQSIASSAKAVALYEEADEPIGLKANGYNNMANSYARMGDLAKAEEYFTKALQVVTERGKLHMTANLRVNLAIIKGLKGDTKRAREELMECMEAYEAQRHKAGIAETNLNIAHLYRTERNYAEAMRHYVKAIAVLKEIKNKQSLAEAYVGLAKVYMSLKGWDDALKQIALCEKIFRTIDHPNGRIEMLKAKAEILQQTDRQTEAEAILQEVETYAAQYGIDHKATLGF